MKKPKKPKSKTAVLVKGVPIPLRDACKKRGIDMSKVCRDSLLQAVIEHDGRNKETQKLEQLLRTVHVGGYEIHRGNFDDDVDERDFPDDASNY